LRVGLFGGTFDPIHDGHLRMARAAEAALNLDRIYFAPARAPWHKPGVMAEFEDRFAMTALALQRHPRWLPLALAPRARFTYSTDEVAAVRRMHPRDHVFFLLGADAFADIRTWKHYRRLLAQCDFIVLARAGFDLAGMGRVLPPRIVRGWSAATGELRLAGGNSLYWVRFRSAASSTLARTRLGKRGPAPVPAAVRAYAVRAGLYGARKREQAT
jgi:nicotinate-nucleotide adenylyltransferase